MKTNSGPLSHDLSAFLLFYASCHIYMARPSHNFLPSWFHHRVDSISMAISSIIVYYIPGVYNKKYFVSNYLNASSAEHSSHRGKNVKTFITPSIYNYRHNAPPVIISLESISSPFLYKLISSTVVAINSM